MVLDGVRARSLVCAARSASALSTYGAFFFHTTTPLYRCAGDVTATQLVAAWAPDFFLGAEPVFRPRKRMSSFFRLKWGVQILCLFNQNQTPRSDSANLEPSEPIFCPHILEPRCDRDSYPAFQRGKRERDAFFAKMQACTGGVNMCGAGSPSAN